VQQKRDLRQKTHQACNKSVIYGRKHTRRATKARFTAENTPGVQQKREGARGDIQECGGPRES
jgi:hypothetical protein